jgi:hypothetical protein
VNLKRTPLAPAAVAFGAGIAVSSLAAPAAFLAAWLLAIAACLVLLAVSRTVAAAIALLLGVVAVGGLRGRETPLPPDHVQNLGLPRTLRVEGQLADEPRRFTQDRARLLIDTERVEDAPGSGLIQVTAYGILPSLTQGQRVAAPLRLHAASGFRNPGTYDYAAHLVREGIRIRRAARRSPATVVGARQA